MAVPAICDQSSTSRCNRLKALGVEYVYMVQWHWLHTLADGSWTIVKADDSFGPVSDADLRYFTAAVHAAGMKAMMFNQIQAIEDRAAANNYVVPATMENLGKWFAAYQTFMGERSVFFQAIGVDVWEVGCASCMFGDSGDNSPAAQALFRSEYMKTLAIMKRNYTGQTLTSMPPWAWEAPEFLHAVDVISFGPFARPSVNAAGFDLSVASYRAAIDDSGWASGLKQLDDYGKILLTPFSMQSRANALTLPGYMEETVCTTSMGDFNAGDGKCIQDATRPDFALQAIVFEAILESINALNLKSKLIAMPADYWETDGLETRTAFPSLGTSPRNKPAEGILKAWFARP